MPSKRKPAKPLVDHTHISIRVTEYDAAIRGAVNGAAYAPKHAQSMSEDDPIYQFKCELRIAGTAGYPKERAEQRFDLTIYGDDAYVGRQGVKLRDLQARDARGAPLYRMYRGRQVPVYERPSSLGLLNKVRGEPAWNGWAFVATRFVSDAVTLLAGSKQVFIELHERKEKRSRWIQGLSLQTTDPAEE